MPTKLANTKLATEKLLAWVLLPIFVFAFSQSTLSGQETIGTQKDLPQHASWRVGEFGDAEDSTPSRQGIYRIKYSPDGKFLATRNKRNVVTVYDLKTHAMICEVEGHEDWIETIDFSPNGEFFVTASGDGDKVKIWKTQTGALESEIETLGIAAFFDKNGKQINVLGETHVESYSWPGVQRTRQRKWQGNNSATAKHMSRDGRYVVAFRALNRPFYQSLLIDTESKSRVPLAGATAVPRTVKISADNKWVAATYHREPKVRLWEIGNSKNTRYTLAGHEDTVQSLSFSADNRFLVSSGWDKNVFVWDLLTRQSINNFKGHNGHVNATAFAPFGFAFATGASGLKDCSMITWDMKEVLFDKAYSPDKESDLSVDEQFEPIWKSLGTSSLKLSIKATSKLAAGGDYFLGSLEKKVQSDISLNRSVTTETYIKQLDSPDYALRDQATRALLKMVKEVEARLRNELKQTTSPEVKYRISMILKSEPPRGKSDLVLTRRWYRIILALEQINTERSQAILKLASQGHRSSEIALHAAQSYRRNVKRAKLTE